VVLVCNSEQLISDVLNCLDQQMESLPRKSIAKKCLEQSKLLYFEDLTLAMDFINQYAPEHLIINTNDPEKWAKLVINAGSVFLGAYTPESLGDYASGTNHTLPTNGYARMYAGVSLDSYMKKVTFQKATVAGLKNVGPAVEIMAQAEGLAAHKQAVRVRLESLGS
jgi:histidinol dehydrogenase